MIPPFRRSRLAAWQLVALLTLASARAVSADELDSLLAPDPAPFEEPKEEGGEAEAEPRRPADDTGNSTLTATSPSPGETEPAADDSASRPPPPTVQRHAVEEIVVTAQHRAEDVRDVPMALSVLSGEDLRDQALSGFDDIARYVPAVSFHTDMNSLYLRGIGTAELNPVGEQAVVYIMDDVYLPRLDYLKPGLFDVRQFQLLKGPQGTLYGRNATGGVIKIDYGEPSRELEGYVNLTGGMRERLGVEGALGGPVTEKLSARLAGRFHEEGDFVENLYDGGGFGARTISQWRAKLRYEPFSWLETSFGVERFAYDIGLWGGSEIHEYPEESRDNIERLDPTIEYDLDRRGSMNGDVRNRSEGSGWVVPAKLIFDLWSHEITSISAFGSVDDFQGGDVDGTGARLVELITDLESERWSQEFRMTSPPGALEYVSGLFLYRSTFGGHLDVPTVPDPGVETLSDSEVDALAGILAPSLEPGTDPVATVLGIDEQLDNLQADVAIEVESLGLYGQLKWSFLDSLAVIIGGRVSRDQRKGHFRLFSQGPFWFAATQGGHDTRRRFVDVNFSPKVSLLSEAMQEVTAYLTYAQGYRGGSFNVSALTPEQFSFDPESSDTFEAGVKTEWLEGLLRWNLGGFLTFYDDYQIVAFNGLGYIINNAEKVETRGFESDLTAVLPGSILVNGSMGFNDAGFEKFTTGTCPTEPPSSGNAPQVGTFNSQVCDLSGRPLFRAPTWTGSVGASWESSAFPVGLPVPVQFHLGGDATYKGGEFMDSDLDPLDYQTGYWLFNGRIGLRTSDGQWGLDLHGKNLADELVKVFSGDPVAQPGAHWALTNPPRTIFASLRYSY